MAKGRDIAAESISDLLDIALLQRRNGMLRVECSQRGYLEEGEIYLQAGEPIYAHTDMLTAYEAFHYLLSWRSIYFAFASEVPKPPANLMLGLKNNRGRAPVLAPAAPVPSMRASAPAMHAPAVRVPTAQGPRWNPVDEHATTTTSQKPPAAHRMTRLAPYRAGLEQHALSLPLNRRQRLIYILIDGKRTAGDLARTTGRPYDEVELILSELQEQGLIVM